MPIDSVSGNILPPTPIADVIPKAGPALPEAKDQWGQDTFLKLLVAQLRYQDPMNPADSSEFMAQTAQFTSVEKLNEMAKLNTEMLAAQRVMGASAMIGKTVTYADAEGKELTGVVTSARMTGDAPVLRIGTAEIAMTDVREVHTTAPAGPAA